MSQSGFFDYTHRQEKLKKMHPFFDELNEIIIWENFRSILEAGIKRSKIGRPAYDLVLMFKILILPDSQLR